MALTLEQLWSKAVQESDRHAAEHGVQGVMIHQLQLIAMLLDELRRTASFGTHYYRLTPVQLSTAVKQVVDKNTQGLVRKVDIWVDNIVGGAVPNIRVGTQGSVSSDRGGIRIVAGQMNELGEIPPDVQLYAIASSNIQVYVIEKA